MKMEIHSTEVMLVTKGNRHRKTTNLFMHRKQYFFSEILTYFFSNCWEKQLASGKTVHKCLFAWNIIETTYS